MIWTTVSSRSCFSSVYRASPSLAAKNIINLISVMTIWWCPRIEFSLVLLEECVCYDQCVPSTILSKVLEVLHPQWAFTHTHYQSGQYPGRLESRSEACSALSLNPKQDYLFNFPNRQHWALKSRWCHLRVRIAGLSQQLGWVCTDLWESGRAAEGVFYHLAWAAFDCANLGAVNSLVSSSSTIQQLKPQVCLAGPEGLSPCLRGLSDCFLKDKARDAAIR